MEIARALAIKSKLLLMDEAMARMHPRDLDDIVRFLKRVSKEENIVIVSMVEHIMRAVAGFARRVMVMHRGAKLVDAPTSECLSHSSIIPVFLGRPSGG